MAFAVRVTNVSWYFSRERFRVPLKFGTGAITHITCMTAEVQIEGPSGTATGRGCILLSDLWAWPSQRVGHEIRDQAMRLAGELACRALADIAAKPAEPLDISWELKQCLQDIGAQVQQMLPPGVTLETYLWLLDEVRRLASGPKPLGKVASQALGYRELLAHLAGDCSLEEAVELIKLHTRQFAKAQMTWFKRIEGVRWFDVARGETPEHTAGRLADFLGSLT